jgi:hypothetical protein
MRWERRHLSTVLSGLFVLLCGAIVFGALNNAFGTEPQLEEQARDLACSSQATAAPPAPSACQLQTSRLESNPFHRAFEFEDGKTRVRIECTRSFGLVGAYQCKQVF